MADALPGDCEPPGPRERLLDAAVEFAARNGVADASLRQIATALGTSHRMLIYHFGSREQLLVEIVRAVEARQREVAARVELASTSLGTDAIIEGLRSTWRRFADPAMAPWERLFFEIYGQALQGRPGTAGFLDGIVDDWLEMLTQYSVQLGSPQEHARADARLGVAVMRGLLLDLLATGDRAGIDEAVERFIMLAEAAPRPGPG